VKRSVGPRGYRNGFEVFRAWCVERGHSWLRGLPPTIAASSEVRLAMRLAMRTSRARPRQSQGLTLDLLGKIVAACPETLAGTRDAAIIVAGRDGLARKRGLSGLARQGMGKTDLSQFNPIHSTNPSFAETPPRTILGASGKTHGTDEAGAMANKKTDKDEEEKKQLASLIHGDAVGRLSVRA